MAGEHAADEEPDLVRVNLGAGRLLQVLVDETSSQIHLTFLNDEGTALDVSSLALTGISPSGDEIDVPTTLFEAGHYVVDLDLEPGEWEFDVQGAASEGGDLSASFETHVP